MLSNENGKQSQIPFHFFFFKYERSLEMSTFGPLNLI